MSDLHAERLTPNKQPFYCTGVDFFGPFTVRQARSYVKKYGCIFTCLASRAVHLEVAHALTVDSFINAFRRFASRRGKVHTSIPSLKSRNYGAPAAPTRCGIASGAPVAVVVVFGGANVDCCGQLAGG